MTIQNDIIQAIKESNTIIIHRHVRPDPDAIGSQGGLQHLIKTSFPEKNVYAVGEEIESLSFLNRMDNVDDETYKNALVIVCDTANEPRISDERYKTGVKLIKIDHHPNRTPYGDISWVNTEASSTSEMIYDLLSSSDELTLNDKGAQLLYAGITGDTGRFLYPNTTPKTLATASELVKYDFKPKDMFDELYKMKRNVVQLNGYMLLNHEVTEKGVAHFKMTQELMQKHDVNTITAANLINNLANIEGNIIWVFFIEEDEEIRVRIRSKGPVINEIASKYNGGGHPLASGASLTSWEEAPRLIEDLNQLI